MLKSAELRTYIDTQRERKALEVDFTKTDWLREMVAQVRANPDEVTQIRLVSCDACWEAAPGERQPMWQEPNPDCAHCQGDGIPRAWFADTRKLSPGARRLFQSVQQTKDGLRVHLRDQDAALVNLGKALGVFELDNRQKNVSLAEALQGFIGGLHSQARIKTVRTPGKQGTAGKTQAEPNPEPNGNPVGSESVPRNPLVKG